MQLRKENFYTTMQERYGVDPELSSSVCSFIFRKWNEWQRLPDNLRLDIKFLGVHILRYAKTRQKYKKMVRKTFDFSDKSKNTFKGPKEESIYDREKLFLERMEHLMEEVYPKFKEERNDIYRRKKEVEIMREPIFVPRIYRKEINPIEE